MPGTETDSVAETRQHAQPVEGLAQVDTSAIPPQAAIVEIVDANSAIPPPEATRDNREVLEERPHDESLQVPDPGSHQPSETVMNTRTNAGYIEVPPVVRGEPQVERDAANPGPSASQSPPHFVPWLSSPAPQMFASPLAYPMLVPQPAAGALPPGFQAYAAVAPAPQPISSSPYAQPQPAINPFQPGFQAYINPAAPPFQPLPSLAYAQSPFVPRSAPQGGWGYVQPMQQPYYTTNGPIGRRKEVYVSQDPFHKRSQPNRKPSRVPYNPYAPADSSNLNPGPISSWPAQHRASHSLPPRRTTNDSLSGPSWYRPSPLGPDRPYKQETYDSQTGYEPYLPMPYPPGRPQSPIIASSPPRRATFLSSRQSDDALHLPGAIPSGPEQGKHWNTLPGQAGQPVIYPSDAVVVGDANSSVHRGTPPPRSPRSVPSTGSSAYSPASPAYSVISERYSPISPAHPQTSPVYPPPSSVIPDLPARIELPPPHEVSVASSSALSLESASRVASSVHSAASPTTPTRAPSNGNSASVISKHSYSPPDSPFRRISPRISGAAMHTLPPPHELIDAEKQDRPHRPSRQGINRVFPESLRSWARRASRWVKPPRMSNITSAQSSLYEKEEEPEYTSVSEEKSGIMSAVVEFATRKVPTDLYLVFLLFLPSFYFSRVARLFEEAELAMPEIEQMAIRTSLQAQNFLDEQVPDGQDVFPLQWIRLKSTWEHFIDSLLREWKTLNVISALLLSAILTILQIDDAANDYLTRYTALLSFICSLVSLLFGCIYIIRFATMRKTYKAAEWAMEAQESGTSTWWNVFILLALPSIWLTWSILLYVVCIMSYIWRTAANTSESPPPLSDLTVLKIRIGISILLGLALVYACFILATFRRYGSAMDRKWAARIEHWRLVNTYTPGGPPGPPGRATWDSPYPYAYPGGSVFSSVPRDIHREGRPVEKPPVRFRDNESYIPRASVPFGTPPDLPPSWGDRYRNSPVIPRERPVGSFDIYQSELSNRWLDSEARPAPSPPVRPPSLLGPRSVDSERPPQIPSSSLPYSLPFRSSPESFRPSSHDRKAVGTSASSLSLQNYPSHSPHVEAPTGLASSIVEGQSDSPAHIRAELSGPDTTTSKSLLSEAFDERAAEPAHIPKQGTRTTSRTHSPSHSGDKLHDPGNHHRNEVIEMADV